MISILSCFYSDTTVTIGDRYHITSLHRFNLSSVHFPRHFTGQHCMERVKFESEKMKDVHPFTYHHNTLPDYYQVIYNVFINMNFHHLVKAQI